MPDEVMMDNSLDDDDDDYVIELRIVRYPENGGCSLKEVLFHKGLPVFVYDEETFALVSRGGENLTQFKERIMKAFSDPIVEVNLKEVISQ